MPTKADILETKVGDMVRICFPARGKVRAQLGHPVEVLAVYNGEISYMTNFGFPDTAKSWVRVPPKLEIAKWVMPPESSTARMRMIRQAGSARTYG